MAGPDKNGNEIENNAPERPFNEIDELARAAEVETRKREKLHTDKVDAATSPRNSRGKANERVTTAEYTDMLSRFITKYQNDPHLTDAAKADKENEYTLLLKAVYHELFDGTGFTGEFDSLLKSNPADVRTMLLNRTAIGEKIPKMLDALEKAEKNLEKTMLYEESEKDNFVRELLTDMYDIHTTVERNAYGTLQIPHDKEKKNDNGKVIHRVVQARDNSGKWIQPEVDDNYKKLLSNNALFVNCKDYPLFDHEPNETDVQQGGLGNCYFMAALASTAAQAPELIKDMMKFNPKDNTVTVRFYNDKQEPVYVTIDNSVPVKNIYDSATKQNYPDRPHGQRAHWVQLLEKAYTVSGLACGKLSAAEKGTYRPQYEHISGGFSNKAFSHFFGYGTNELTREIGAFDFARDEHNREYAITARNFNGIEIGKKGKPYTQTENIFFEILRESFDRNHTIATSIKNGANVPAGLYANHAYSMMGVEEDKTTGKKYVLLRNPHATKGGEYGEDGQPVGKIKKHADGCLRMELRGYLKTFDRFFDARHDTSFLYRTKKQELNETLNKYKKAVDFIHKALEENDNGFLRVFGYNSPQFNAFRTSALKAYSQFRTSPYSVDKMKQSLKDMTDAAKAYTQYRDNITDNKYDHTAARSVNRYNVAAMAKLLGDEFDKMEAPDSKICRTVELANLIKTIRETGAGNTAASASAFDKLGNIEKKAGGVTL